MDTDTISDLAAAASRLLPALVGGQPSPQQLIAVTGAAMATSPSRGRQQRRSRLAAAIGVYLSVLVPPWQGTCSEEQPGVLRWVSEAGILLDVIYFGSDPEGAGRPARALARQTGAQLVRVASVEAPLHSVLGVPASRGAWRVGAGPRADWPEGWS